MREKKRKSPVTSRSPRRRGLTSLSGAAGGRSHALLRMLAGSLAEGAGAVRMLAPGSAGQRL